MAPAPISCWGICGGDPSWRDPRFGTCCTVCQGSGIFKLPASHAEEYESVRRARDARRGLSGPDRGLRKSAAVRAVSAKRGRAKKRAALSVEAIAARRLNWEFEKAWRARYAPSGEQLDELREENVRWSKRRR